MLQITNFFNSPLTYHSDINNKIPELRKSFNKLEADLPKSPAEIMKKHIPMTYHKNAARFTFGLSLSLCCKSPLSDIKMLYTHVQTIS